MKINKLFLPIIFFLFIILFPSNLFADSLTITAIPPRKDITVNPGGTVVIELKVRNESDTSIIYEINSDDFIVVDKIGTPIPTTNKNNKWSLKSWLTHSELVPVDANSTQIVPLTIKVPSKALAGGHYAMVTYTPSTRVKPGEMKKTASAITQRVGTLLYVTVGGDITEKANITSFIAPKFTEKGPVEFTGTIENLSNVHLQPKGFIAISNLLGKEVAKIPLDTGNIFPENSKAFSGIWDQKWGYGRYKADLNLVYGSANTILMATIFFWLFPIRLVIYSLITLVSVLTIIVLLNKRSQRHQEELEKEVRELQKEIGELEKK